MVVSRISSVRSAARLVVPAFVVAVVVGAGVAADAGSDLTGVLERFDRVQASIRTLSADFTWTTSSPLLKDPIRSRGRLYMTKPDAIRWEFTAPEEMAFVIARDEYVGYFPARKTAERRDFGRWSEKLFRYFGVGQGSAELSKVYDISLGEADDPAMDVLVLEPRKRRARKRIERLTIHVDRVSGLPARLVSEGADGGSRTIELRDVRINPELSAGLYEFRFPPDVEVTHGAAGLGGALQLAPGPSSR